MKKILFNIITTILTFFLIYKCSFAFLGIPEQLHSVRLATFFLVIYAFILSRSSKFPNSLNSCTHSGKLFRCFVKLYSWYAFYSFILIAILGYTSGESAFSHIVHTLIIAILAIWAYCKIFDDLDSFMKVLMYVGVLQSIIILICLFNPSFVVILNSTFNKISDVTSVYTFDSLINRYAGGIGCITSSGVIRFASGVMACTFLYIKTSRIYYLVVFLFFAVISSLIARTGLIIDLICLFFIIIAKFKNVKVLITLVIIIIAGLNIDYSSNSFSTFIDERFFRYEVLFEDKGKYFFEAYIDGDETSVPSIEENFIIGTGIVKGVAYNGCLVNVDGGFRRVYSAFGLIGAIIFYFVLIRNCFSLLSFRKNKYHKVLLHLLFACLLIGEFKEFFLLLHLPFILIVVIATLTEIEENK